MIASPDRGFTLIEILIVVVIIGILAGFTVIGVVAALASAKVSHTEALITTISGALESYKMRWGDYPPSTVQGLGRKVRVPNATNNGIESLVACLASKRQGGVLLKLSTEDLYSNTDKDKASGNLTDWFFGDNQLREVTDHFGNTLTYLHHRDYKKPPREVLQYVPSEGASIQTIKAVESEKTKTYARPTEFQIMSFGRDGELGGGDDIFGW